MLNYWVSATTNSCAYFLTYSDSIFKQTLHFIFKKWIFYIWSQTIVLFRIKLLLRELWAKFDFSRQIWFSHVITKSRPFSRKVDIRELWAKFNFSRQIWFSHVITKSRPFSRKADVKGVISENRFFKTFFFISDHKILISAD